jgi:multifunctional beta-oxidation protein
MTGVLQIRRQLRKAWNGWVIFLPEDEMTCDLFSQLVENFSNQNDDKAESGNKAEEERFFDPEDSELVKEAKRLIPDATEYSYDERDVIIYNMGLGATEKDLQWVFEGEENFAPLPTFGVCPQFLSSAGFPFDWLPNFNFVCVSSSPSK